MARAVDGRVGEVAVVAELGVATDLAVDEELLPGLGDGPVEVVDPGTGAVRGHSHIGITRVLEDSVLVAEVYVDVDRAVRILVILGVYIRVAEVPGWGGSDDIELGFNGGVVQVVNSRLGVDARRGQFQSTLVKEGGVLGCSEVLLSILDLVSSPIESVKLGRVQYRLEL